MDDGFLGNSRIWLSQDQIELIETGNVRTFANGDTLYHLPFTFLKKTENDYYILQDSKFHTREEVWELLEEFRSSFRACSLEQFGEWLTARGLDKK